MVLLLDHLPAQDAVVTQNPLLELSVVIPTYKERQNIAPLLAALQTCLQGINWEVIFVDDHSPDHTADEVRALALSQSTSEDSRAHRATRPVFCMH